MVDDVIDFNGGASTGLANVGVDRAPFTRRDGRTGANADGQSSPN